MRPADRLFRLLQLLRAGRVMTAAELAERLEVSERTIYRDMDHLSASGVPVVSERGVGYALLRSFELPPLAFEAEEARALLLGLQMVQRLGDDAIAAGARSALEKIEAVLERPQREALLERSLIVPDIPLAGPLRGHLNALRAAVKARRKLLLDYRDAAGAASQRVVRPLGLFFINGRWLLGAWCELRADLRSFSLNRVQQLTVLEEPIEPETPDVDAYIAAQRQRARERADLN